MVLSFDFGMLEEFLAGYIGRPVSVDNKDWAVVTKDGGEDLEVSIIFGLLDGCLVPIAPCVGHGKTQKEAFQAACASAFRSFGELARRGLDQAQELGAELPLGRPSEPLPANLDRGWELDAGSVSSSHDDVTGTPLEPGRSSPSRSSTAPRPTESRALSSPGQSSPGRDVGGSPISPPQAPSRSSPSPPNPGSPTLGFNSPTVSSPYVGTPASAAGLPLTPGLQPSSSLSPPLVGAGSEGRTTVPPESTHGSLPPASIPPTGSFGAKPKRRAPPPPPPRAPLPTDSVLQVVDSPQACPAQPNDRQPSPTDSVSIDNAVAHHAGAATSTTEEDRQDSGPPPAQLAEGFFDNSSPSASASGATTTYLPRGGLKVMRPGEAWNDRRVEINERLPKYLGRALRDGDLVKDFNKDGPPFCATFSLDFPEDKPRGGRWRGLSALSKKEAEKSASSLVYDWLVAQMEGRHDGEDENDERPLAIQDGSMQDDLAPGAIADTASSLVLSLPPTESHNWRGALEELQAQRKGLEGLLVTSGEAGEGRKWGKCQFTYQGEPFSERVEVPGKEKDAKREACRHGCMYLKERGVQI